MVMFGGKQYIGSPMVLVDSTTVIVPNKQLFCDCCMAAKPERLLRGLLTTFFQLNI